MKKIIILAVSLFAVVLAWCSFNGNTNSKATMVDNFSKYKECYDMYNQLKSKQDPLDKDVQWFYYSDKFNYCIEEYWYYDTNDQSSFYSLIDLRNYNTILDVYCSKSDKDSCLDNYNKVRDYYIGSWYYYTWYSNSWSHIDNSSYNPFYFKE